MFFVEFLDGKTRAVQLQKGFLGRNKKLIFADLPEDLRKKEGIVLLSQEAAFLYKEEIGDKGEVAELLKQRISNLGLTEDEATFFSADVKESSEKSEVLLTILKKEKTGFLQEEAGRLQFKIVGGLPEQLVLHKLLQDEINPDEQVLVLHIGEEKSYIYLLDKITPSSILTKSVATDKIIPHVFDIVKKNKLCRSAVYFGEKSLVFDKGLLAKQTGIKVVAAVSVLKKRLAKAGIEFPEKKIAEFVLPAAAAILFGKKDVLNLGKPVKPELKKKPELPEPLQRPEPPEPQEPDKPPTKLVEKKRLSGLRLVLISLGVALVVAGLILSGWRYFVGTTPQDISPIPTHAALPTPTPTPVPAIEPAGINVRILNGSGIPGVAGEIAVRLEDAGFTIVEIGNAEVFTFTQTQIRYKDGGREKADLVVKNLDDQEASVGASLEEDDVVDVEITIGTQ